MVNNISPINRKYVNGTLLHIWLEWNDKCISLLASLSSKTKNYIDKLRYHSGKNNIRANIRQDVAEFYHVVITLSMIIINHLSSFTEVLLFGMSQNNHEGRDQEELSCKRHNNIKPLLLKTFTEI